MKPARNRGATGVSIMGFPFQNFVYAVLCGLGIVTAVNVDIYREDLAAIDNQVTVTETERLEHVHDAAPRQISLPPPRQVQATPRPAARGEDFATAQLLPVNRRAVDFAHFADDEAIAFLASGMVVVVKHGLDGRARKRDQEKRETEKREQEKRDREESDRAELDRDDREREKRDRQSP